MIEEEICNRYGSVGMKQEMRCPVHISIGQESIAVWSAVGILWLLIFPVSLLTGRLFSLVWDDYVDLRGSYRRARFSNSDKQELASLLGKIKVELADFD